MRTLLPLLPRRAAFSLLLIGLTLPPTNAAAQMLFEQLSTDANQVELFTTNYGIVGLDVQSTTAGAFWPRSNDFPGAYMFGAGVWFGAITRVDDKPEKRVFMSFNPNTSLSWAAPGDVSDGPELQDDAASIAKYRIYRSTDYNPAGQPLDGEAPAWPLWNPDQLETGVLTGELGRYVSNIEERSIALQHSEPVFVSDEDLVCRFKDTDVNLYEGGAATARPIGLQFEQALYSWADPENENYVMLRYDITNVSGADLQDCVFGLMNDFDIGEPLNSTHPSLNDRMVYHEELAARQMVVMWSENGSDVKFQGYGYFGMAMLQSPMLDDDNYVIQDGDPTDYDSQIGLTTVRYSDLGNNPTTDEDRYDFMTSGVFESAFAPDDYRVWFGGGTFNLRAGETARFVIGLFFAPSVSGVPDGSPADLERLIAEVDKGHKRWSGRVESSVDLSAEYDFGLQLSPNPVRDQLTLVFNTETSGAQSSIDILDQAGRRLLTRQLRARAQHESVTLSLDGLAAGSYFCRLRTGERQQTRGFVLVR